MNCPLIFKLNATSKYPTTYRFVQHDRHSTRPAIISIDRLVKVDTYSVKMSTVIKNLLLFLLIVEGHV